jgi:hypothetical protein
MGNQTMLYFGDCCEFEASNCLPVTWLALFGLQDFVVEERREGSEEYEIAAYRTSHSAALERVNSVIDRLQGQTPVWAYLRPLEILRDELRLCSSDQPVELDVTQFYRARNQVYRQRVIEGPAAFAGMLEAITGDEARDLALLNQLVSDYSLFGTSSVADLHPEDRMFVLIGTYWGEREDLYTLEYFGESYWTVGP